MCKNSSGQIEKFHWLCCISWQYFVPGKKYQLNFTNPRSQCLTVQNINIFYAGKEEWDRVGAVHPNWIKIPPWLPLLLLHITHFAFLFFCFGHFFSYLFYSNIIFASEKRLWAKVHVEIWNVDWYSMFTFPKSVETFCGLQWKKLSMLAEEKIHLHKSILSFFGPVSTHHSNISHGPRGPASQGTKGLKPKLHGTFRKQPNKKIAKKIEK